MRTTIAFLILGLRMAGAPTTARAQLSTAREPAAETAPAFDPLKAKKDMEVGTFYFKKGNYDAAVDRFLEAAKLQPGVALPYLKLGETYEKKKDFAMAVAAYRKYLELYRSAPNAKDVNKKLADLEKKTASAKGTK
jgi:tetratricopeptide (TPR) repeat protein